jgi:ribulose 1,5-bisphosphate synthetase/thiazole synthase
MKTLEADVRIVGGGGAGLAAYDPGLAAARLREVS